MAVSVQIQAGSYERYVEAHADAFSGYLRRLLGGQGEERGGRVGAADTLQEALLRIHAEWPELEAVDPGERDRHAYRCLRDAAGAALRRECGRHTTGTSSRPRVVAFDFESLEAADGELSATDRELSVAVLGAMARDVADHAESATRSAVLDRCVLLAGLRALAEREAVVLIAVDHLGWEPAQVAERLALDVGGVRQTLFVARRVFYGVVRHAVGIELGDTERATLEALQAGDLSGREKRLAKRHLEHCSSCRAFVRQRRVFGADAHRVLTPLPFVVGGELLRREAPRRALVSLSGAGHGLLGQPGAAKALAATVALLGVGTGGVATLAQLHENHHAGHSGPVAGSLAASSRLGTLPAPSKAPASKASSHPSRGSSSGSRAHHTKRTSGAQSSRRTSSGSSRPSVNAPAPTTASASSPPAASTPPTKAAGSSNTGSSAGGSGGGSEFFGGP